MDDPPPPERLAGLPDVAWEVVVAAARQVLNEAERLPPPLRRLRAVPDQRLRRGRSRRDLAAAIADDEELWAGVRRRLVAADGGSDVLELLAHDAPPAAADDGEIASQAARLRRRVGGLEAEIDRVRARARELVDERDEARRRAEGLAARLETERARTAEEAEARRRAERDRGDLERRLAEADEERRSREERLRRRHESEVASMREELRTLRREAEEREQDRVRDERVREAVEQRAQEEIATYRAAREPASADAATSGRPHRLPTGVAPGTARALAAVLATGPRLLIDGYNVSKQHHDEAPLDQQRDWLHAVAERVAARSPVVPTIVFDGDERIQARPGTARRRTQVVFSRGRTADDEIVAIVEGLSPDEPVVVVTDDRELAERVSRHRADVFGTAVLLAVAG